MAQNTQNTQHTPVQNQDSGVTQPTVEKFAGYTLEEIRYHRALVALKAEFCKEKIVAEFNASKKNSLLGRFKRGEGTGLFKSGVLNKMAKSLNYIDYLLVGTAAFKAVRSFTSLFRRNKGNV